jgi:D-serine dehydratase
MSELAKWYVVHTYSGYENSVAANILKAAENRKMQDLIQEVNIPMETVKEIVGGGFTVSDEHLFTDLHALHETERLFVEPSACAGFAGAVELSKMTDYLESSGLGAHWENAAHIVWATGGALVPEGEREKYLAN